VGSVRTTGSAYLIRLRVFALKNKAALIAAVIFFVATASFMWPMFTHFGTYSDGGDHMFNAWTLARNHFCLIGQSCPNYDNANIFFPHKDTMLYSETQLSAGFLTLPFFILNHNPLFSANIWYFLSAFFAGFFMYLLARYLSKGNQAISILAGLVFEFAPTKITSMDHMQNLSIFYLPLIILLLLKYRDTGFKKYLAWFTVCCSLLFLASWYQMVFALMAIVPFIIYVSFLSKPMRRRALYLVAGVLVALITTLPLAKEYVRFSKQNKAAFSIQDQITYSSSVNDYFLPFQGTVVGSLYYKVLPHSTRNTHNLDSYSYTGVSLYLIGLACIIALFKRNRPKLNKESKYLLITLLAVGIIGFIVSLGPVVKIGYRYIYHVHSVEVVFAAPYILVDKFLPQLSFMRALGRASELLLFSLCCFLAIYSVRLGSVRDKNKRLRLTILLVAVIALDVLPLRLINEPLHKIDSFQTSFSVPHVYQYINDHKSIDNLVVIRTQKDYPNAVLPTALPEDILWSGYDNRNIFNGYSGYYPPEYQPTLQGFQDLAPGTTDKMKSLGLKYVLLDKQLSKNRPQIRQDMSQLFSKKVYEDNRYALFKI
jgi:hypothetical protein